MMKYLGFTLLFLLAVIKGFSVGESYNPVQIPKASSIDGVEKLPLPWLTGPLLAPSGHVVPAGYINFEPYLFYTVNTGEYDDDWKAFSLPNEYTLQFQTPFWIGLTKWMDLFITPSFSWNRTQGVGTTVFNDFSAALAFQILQDTQENNIPGLKVFVLETFPTGPYQKRNPKKLETDIGGAGAYNTLLGFVITRLFHIYGDHWISFRFNGNYRIPSNVHVEGFNAYGGARDTKGTVDVGQSFSGFLGLEYSFSKNWGLAFDAVGKFSFADRFSGNPGTNPDGSPAVVGEPESYQFSIAPAIEYNFSADLGVIAGAWLSVSGKNSDRFISAVIALNYFGPITKKPPKKHKYDSSL